MTTTTERAGTRNLHALAREHLAAAQHSPHGRSAYLFVHDGPLRQTIVAITQGTELAEHNSPPAATLYVLTGAVVLRSQDAAEVECAEGEILSIPMGRHAVQGVNDSVFILTTVTSTPLGGREWGIDSRSDEE